MFSCWRSGRWARAARPCGDDRGGGAKAQAAVRWPAAKQAAVATGTGTGQVRWDSAFNLLVVIMSCLVSNKSPTYKLKNKKNDLIYQTILIYKSPQLISFKQLHPNLKLISPPFPRGAHTF